MEEMAKKRSEQESTWSIWTSL